MSHAAEADVLVGWRPTQDLLVAAEDARYFLTPATGVNATVETFRSANAIRRRPIVLVNSHGNAEATAQHAVALLLSLLNGIVPHHNAMAAGRWRTSDALWRSVPLRGATVGLAGFGAINRRVMALLAGFRPVFVALRRRPEPIEGVAAVFGPAHVNEFLRRSDMAILALPLTAETEGLIGSEQMAALGPDGFLVNVGRGATVREAALYEALRHGQIAGAALDVWYDYAPESSPDGRRYPSRHPFHELDNVVLSPHRGASSDSLDRWDDLIEAVRQIDAGREPANVVDLNVGY